MSFLGRIHLFKITILPKQLYPVSMIVMILKLNYIRDISKAMSDFIQTGRKHNSQKNIIGILPRMENDVLSVHARIISFRVIEQEGLLWLEMEVMIIQPFPPTTI